MDVYILSLAVFGFVALSVSWVKHLTRLINVSYPIVFMAAGIAIFSFIPDLPWASPYSDQLLTMHLTEAMVIISLMGTGLRIDKPFSLSRWAVPLRLVTVAMLISIIGLFALGYWVLGWGLASAVLLGAVLAPTDPVLAGDVQVGPPNSGDGHRAKFSLTAEAGMNDGLAFPFVWLAVALALSAQTGHFSFIEWFGYDVVYRILAGVVTGFTIGKLITYFFFKLPDNLKCVQVRFGLIALSATFFVYGVTEMVHGYGFIAVFVCAVTIRNYDISHEYHETLHEFIDQFEHILLACLLVVFGGSLADGILNHLTFEMALCGLVFLLFLRPCAAYISLVGCRMQDKEKWAIGLFGIRGIGSFFYLAFALNEVDFKYDPQIWSLVAFVVLVSTLGHGLSATHVMRRLEGRS